MPRANRHFIPGMVWHITHRCHKQEFLLKFERDRQRWRHWLFQAKRRYRLTVLNYIVTSNHIHLLVVDDGRGAIAKSMQLIAGRTAQEYNQRKQRKGAFWEDRYHATAVERDDHLVRCMVYIDLNMVRAGAVRHPSEWQVSGYRELQHPPQRYAIIDRAAVAGLCGIARVEDVAREHGRWVEGQMRSGSRDRQPQWSQAIAVGSEPFLARLKDELGATARYRTPRVDNGAAWLEDGRGCYDVSGDGLALRSGSSR